MDRLKMMRAALLKSTAADPGRSAVFVYSDGSQRRQALGLVIAAPDGLVSNAPANFMLPLRPGSQASYQLGNRAPDGSFKPAMTVTCQAARTAQANLPWAHSIPSQWIAVAMRPMHRNGALCSAPCWERLCSRKLVHARRSGGDTSHYQRLALGGAHRPWTRPSPTRLKRPRPARRWNGRSHSSRTAFRNPAAARVSGQDAGMSGKYAAQSCRRSRCCKPARPHCIIPASPAKPCPVSVVVARNAAPLAAPASGSAARSLPAALRSVAISGVCS